MRNKSPLKFLLQGIVVVFAILQLLGLTYILINYPSDWVLLTLCVTTFLVLALVTYRFKRELYVLDKISTAVNEYIQGNFSHRIEPIPANCAIAEIPIAMDLFVDHTKYCFDQINQVFENLTAGDYLARCSTDDMHGLFKEVLDNVNTAFDVMAEQKVTESKTILLSQLGSMNAKNLLVKLQHGQKDLMHITDYMEEMQNTASSNSKDANQNMQKISTVVSSMEEIGKMMNQMTDTVADMDKNQAEIAEMLSLITGIAEQTNLLALNAAIEAARAGEQGRGFAVVADEVRTLAENTKNATAKISVVIDSFRNDVSTTIDVTNKIKQTAEDSTESIKQFEHGFEHSMNSAIEIHSKLDKARDICFTSLVKVDHSVYMQNAYMTMSEGHDSPAAKAVGVDSHNCRLGKWYDSGRGYDIFRNTNSYKLLSEPHARVHNSIHQVIDILKQNWEDDYKLHTDLLANFEKAEAASMDVVHTIENMLEDKNKEI
jgi:methyl-accepting chemotaxis protein